MHFPLTSSTASLHDVTDLSLSLTSYFYDFYSFCFHKRTFRLDIALIISVDGGVCFIGRCIALYLSISLVNKQLLHWERMLLYRCYIPSPSLDWGAFCQAKNTAKKGDACDESSHIIFSYSSDLIFHYNLFGLICLKTNQRLSEEYVYLHPIFWKSHYFPTPATVFVLSMRGRGGIVYEWGQGGVSAVRKEEKERDHPFAAVIYTDFCRQRALNNSSPDPSTLSLLHTLSSFLWLLSHPYLFEFKIPRLIDQINLKY